MPAFIKVMWLLITELWYIWAILIGIALLPFAFGFLGKWIRKKRHERWLRKHQNLAEWRKVSGREFEQITAAVFRKAGYKTKVTGGAGDEGIDVKLRRDGKEYFVQCKRMEKIRPKHLRAFWGSIVDYVKKEEIEKGFFVVTGEFTESGKAFAKDKPIDLIDGFKLEEMYKNLVRDD